MFDKETPGLVLLKPRKDMNNVNCRHDMTEMLLKAALNTIQSINQLTKRCIIIYVAKRMYKYLYLIKMICNVRLEPKNKHFFL